MAGTTSDNLNTPSWPQGMPIPKLESGDHLLGPEFERRYAAMTDLKKAELIEGVVYVGSPVSSLHSDAHGQVSVLAGSYAVRSPGVRMHVEATVRLDERNVFQPDVLLRIDPGGQTHVAADGYVTGPPELVFEVALSTASNDLHAKLHVYLAHGVREYVVWRVLEAAIDWFVFSDGSEDRLPAGPDGIIRSQVFPGLWLDCKALLAGDTTRALAVLEEGLKCPEHAAFVEALGRKSAG